MVASLVPETLIYDLAIPEGPQISPDGCQILYTLARADRSTRRRYRSLWLCDIDGGNPRQIVEVGSGAQWAPDGRLIAYVTPAGDECAISVIASSGTRTQELVRHPDDISSLSWSPDGRRIVYVTPFDPGNLHEQDSESDSHLRVRVIRRIDYKVDGRGLVNDARQQVFIVDLASGLHRRLTTDLVDHRSPRWSPDGRWLAIGIPSPSGWGSSWLDILEVETGDRCRIGTESGVVNSWEWSPSGEGIIFAGDTRPSYQDDWFLYEVASGETHRLTTDLACQPSGSPIWIDERTILFNAARAGATGLYFLDIDTGEVEPRHTWLAVNGAPSIDSARRFVVQSFTSLDRFRELSVFDLQTGRANVITHFGNEVFTTTPPATWERFDVKRGDLTIEAWLLRPPDFDPLRKYPVILTVHGGPHGYYGHKFNWLQHYLATNGYLVVFSNPRGSTSYGRDFTGRVLGDWMGEDYIDLMAVMDAVLERPYIDKQRTGIFGYSYGGHMVAWVIGQTTRFKVAVCGAPSFDLVSQYCTSSGDYEYGEIGWRGAPWENHGWYLARSPSTFAHRAVTPTLIIHGEADQGCPIGQGEFLFTILKKVGCEVEFARYPGAHHGFIDPGVGLPEHQCDFLHRTLDWFQQHL